MQTNTKQTVVDVGVGWGGKRKSRQKWWRARLGEGPWYSRIALVMHRTLADLCD